MTSIFIIYKIRSQEGVPIFAKLMEAYYDNNKAGLAARSYNDMLSHSEKSVGWVYWIQETQIMDQLETSPE
jgi:hypothetical protein